MEMVDHPKKKIKTKINIMQTKMIIVQVKIT
jgi:hypothetical protein